MKQKKRWSIKRRVSITQCIRNWKRTIKLMIQSIFFLKKVANRIIIKLIVQ